MVAHSVVRIDRLATPPRGVDRAHAANPTSPTFIEAPTSKLERLIRRLTAVGALAWLGYLGSQLRDCPSSAAICRSEGFLTSAIIVPVGLVLLGYLLGFACRWAQHLLTADA